MKEATASGKSIEEIRREYARQWGCRPEDLNLEVLSKPGLLVKKWNVKVTWDEQSYSDSASGLSEEAILNSLLDGYDPEDDPQDNKQKSEIDWVGQGNGKAVWDGEKFTLTLGETVRRIEPAPSLGVLRHAGREATQTIDLLGAGTTTLEFYPNETIGELNWEVSVLKDGRKAFLRVHHIAGGRNCLPQNLPEPENFILKEYVAWKVLPGDEKMTAEVLGQDLAAAKIVFGIRDNLWEEVLAVNGNAELIAAEGQPPVLPLNAQIEEFVEAETLIDEKANIDYFASKINLCEKDQVLARKTPGKEGQNGKTIFGTEIPAPKMVDFQFKLGKNTYLSEDGLEVRAACAGSPTRKGNYAYQVESVYVVKADLDLKVGGIDFPGDVIIAGNVHDNLFVRCNGKLQVGGSVSGAKLSAEAGMKIANNVLASQLVVGSMLVFRKELFGRLQEANEALLICIGQMEQMLAASPQVRLGQLFKLLIEKKFSYLPAKYKELEESVKKKDEDFLTPDLIEAIRTLAKNTDGAKALELTDLNILKSAAQTINQFIDSHAHFNRDSANLPCEIGYVQNTVIQCAGSFVCHKGVYNSQVQAGGDIQIHGVCRGGELICNGTKFYAREVGGSAVSSTVLRVEKNSRVNIDYCHANVKIYVGKELITIDERVQRLEVHREEGRVVADRLKWEGND